MRRDTKTLTHAAYLELAMSHRFCLVAPGTLARSRLSRYSRVTYACHLRAVGAQSCMQQTYTRVSNTSSYSFLRLYCASPLRLVTYY